MYTHTHTKRIFIKYTHHWPRENKQTCFLGDFGVLSTSTGSERRA